MREIRDREGNLVWRSGVAGMGLPLPRHSVTITVASNSKTSATGLLPGDRLYLDGVLVYEQEDR
jgi:hypothetical protein